MLLCDFFPHPEHQFQHHWENYSQNCVLIFIFFMVIRNFCPIWFGWTPQWFCRQMPPFASEKFPHHCYSCPLKYFLGVCYITVHSDKKQWEHHNLLCLPCQRRCWCLCMLCDLDDICSYKFILFFFVSLYANMDISKIMGKPAITLNIFFSHTVFWTERIYTIVFYSIP